MKTKFKLQLIQKIWLPGLTLTLALPFGALAQNDPFKKTASVPLQPDAPQPVAAETLQELADQSRPGILGVAVYDFRTGKTVGTNLTRPFSTQSVFKAFVAGAVLAEVDEGKLALGQKITLQAEDLRGGQGSIDTSKGGDFSLSDLLRAALIESDNSAADALVRVAGGPAEITAWLRRRGMTGIRVDRDLLTMLREESGIPADLSPGTNAGSLEDQVPEEIRAAAFAKAMQDSRDTATPEGAIHYLAALKQGKLLSPASTKQMLAWMAGAVTGQGRLRAGFPTGTVLAHKTGTSMEYKGVRRATNDIGLATLPDGRELAIAVFLANAPGTNLQRDAIVAACARLAMKQPDQP